MYAYSPPAHMSSGDEFGSFAAGDHSNSSSQPSSACQPKSPLRAFVRAHLGDLGHTKITTMPGITLANALSKAMKLRKLTMESCVVYNASDPHKVTILIREIVLVKGKKAECYRNFTRFFYESELRRQTLIFGILARFGLEHGRVQAGRR